MRKMAMEMGIRAREDTYTGQDLTPPLFPLSFSLYSSSLLSHCSACFSPLSNPNPSPLSPLYCSPQCSLSDFPIHLSSAENHLLRHHLADSDTSDLRAALRLLYRFEELKVPIISGRIGGLMSNHSKLILKTDNMFNKQGDDGEVLARIKDGARVMAKARRMRDGLDVEIVGDCEVEETILCVVLTNAVEVQVSGGPGVGIAVYDVTFSWINHSCSPNACYRFPLQQSSSGESQLLIVPARPDGVEAKEHSDWNKFELQREGEKQHGPRIVVRSIKAISKGEEVFIAYTDLLQPKAMRQSELWAKYRFICSCQRCSMCPPTYVDRQLQEIFAVNSDGVLLSSEYEDEPAERFADHFDDAVNEYLTYGNPKFCCEKLERLLISGILCDQLESKEAESKHHFFLRPLHHLSLHSYMTLSSAYKTRASDLLAFNSQEKSIQLEAFDMYRFSAAYSLLLTGATHHLYLSEISLAVSVANFWTEAGDSLLNLVRNSFTKLGPTAETFRFFHKYCSYATGSSLGPKKVFEKVSREFFDYITRMVPKVWPFLVDRNCYLKLIKDPIDFSWIDYIDAMRLLSCKDNLNIAATKSYSSTSGTFVCSEQDNINLFQLGVHCLLYGGFLLSTFCGQSPNAILYTIFGLKNPS